MTVPSVTIYSLPQELFDRILALVRSPIPPLSEEWHIQNVDLLAASLVCRRFRSSAQYQLAHDARIILRLDETSLLRPPTLSHAVRHLWLEIKEPGDDAACSEDDEAGIATEWMASFVSANPGLQTLKFAGYLYSSAFSLPGLAPDLTHLDLGFPENIMDLNDEALSIPFQLKHLGLWICDDAPCSSLLTAIFSTSQHSLRSLDLCLSVGPTKRNAGGALFLTTELPLVASKLETLSIRTTARCQSKSLVQLGGCIALKKLALSLVGNDNPSSLRPYLDQLPSPATLTTVSITEIGQLSSLTAILEHPALSRLERLELPNLDGWSIEKTVDGKVLMEVCDRREIKLYFIENLL
ncbi:hypothetical protein P7C70_g7974, partial [Phenoliferia sp. Uapishka_3]